MFVVLIGFVQIELAARGLPMFFFQKIQHRLRRSAVLGVITLASIWVSGCAYRYELSEKEIEIYEEYVALGTATAEIDETIDYARRLGDYYLQLAGEATAGQDALALGVISAAATASGGLLFGSSVDFVKGATLGGATTSQVGAYLQPGEASQFLVNAAEQLACISGSALVAERTLGDDPDFERRAIDVAENAIRNVRINLRKSLARQTPNYASVVEQLSQATMQLEAKGGAESASGGNPEAAVEKLAQEVAECLLISA